MTGLALRARPVADAAAAQDVALKVSSTPRLALVDGRYVAPIQPKEALSLPEGAVLEIEFTPQITQEKEPSDLLFRFFATSEEDPRWWYLLRDIIGNPRPIHGWLALAAVSSHAGESARARFALDRIEVEEFVGMELALRAVTHRQLGDDVAAQVWYARLTEWRKQHPPDPVLENVDEFFTKISGKRRYKKRD